MFPSLKKLLSTYVPQRLTLAAGAIAFLAPHPLISSAATLPASTITRQASASALVLQAVRARSAQQRALFGRRASAASTTLQSPEGMALASNGDLYVADTDGSSIFVYGSNLARKTSSTITNGISYPTSLAFDSAGDLHVANAGTQTITVYNQNHNPVANLTSRFQGTAIVFDALDDLYIAGVNDSTIDFFRSDGTFESDFSVPGLNIVYAAAASRHFIAYGGYNSSGGTSAFYTYVTNQIMSSGQQYAPGYGWQANTVVAMAFDSNEELYLAAAFPNVVTVFTPLQNTSKQLLTLGFEPWGIVVDLAHNHLFVSDLTDNLIAVYTLAGKFITNLH